MKVYKFYEFLLEGNTPEDFISKCLEDVKSRLMPAFNSKDQVKKLDNFKNSNLSLQTDDKNMISKYNPERYMLKIKFIDDQEILYTLTVTIHIEDAIQSKEDKDSSKEFKEADIKKAHVSFDKYGDVNGDFVLVGQLLDKIVNPKDINADYLIKLKLELDKSNASTDEEEFKIETE